MTPEDVLIETIVMASINGDSPVLRQQQCQKLQASIKQYCFAYLSYDHLPARTDEKTH
jgi:hypothetical protein